MKVAHDSSEIIGRCHLGMWARNSAPLAEFHREVMGMHQEVDLNKTEEDLLEELEVLTSRIDFTALATRNWPHGSTDET